MYKRQVLQYRRDRLLVQRVRQALAAHPLQTHSAEALAALLAVSPRTLHRRLEDEGTSFRAVKDSLRRDMAIARLNSSRVPLAVLAGELGFSDSAAFQRAFKGWTGMPPGSYRHPEQG